MTIMSSDDEEYIEDSVDLIPSIQLLRDKCTTILDQCKAWNDQQPIEGLHRYTNSLTAELHFIDKVGHLKYRGELKDWTLLYTKLQVVTG